LTKNADSQRQEASKTFMEIIPYKTEFKSNDLLEMFRKNITDVPWIFEPP